MDVPAPRLFHPEGLTVIRRARHRAAVAHPLAGRFRRRHAVVVGVLAAIASAAGVTAAIAAPAPGDVGHDVSYPQCASGALPSGSAFGIVGVTGGRAYSANPCLATQYKWAKGRPGGAAVYVNTGNPAPASQFYWPASGSRDPALCVDAGSTRDPGCAYDYGWHAATDALAVADKADPGIRKLTWWLDVETANSWNGDGAANTASLQGALDRLRSAGVPSVGLYSTGYQWSTITGGYTTSTAARYRSGWARYFTPRYPLESAPLWIATAGTKDAAKAACTTSFTGAKASLAQFPDNGFDGNIVCGTPRPGAPTAVKAVAGTPRGVTLTWTAPVDADARSYVVGRDRTPTYAQVNCTAATCSWTDTGTVGGRSYSYTVTARNTAGTGPASAAVTARAR